MRKWMRERMKRRKKPAEKGPSETSLTPLQPAYFDVGVPPSPAAGVSPPEPQAVEVPPPPQEAQPAAPQAQAEGGGARRRRRRRGGRGRGGSRPAQAALLSPPPTQVAAREAARAVAPAPREPAPAKAPAVAPAPPRAPRGSVVLAIGLPGSGKSSWFKRHNVSPLSSDLLRSLLFDDPTEQRFQDLIFSNLRSMLKARLIARRPLNYVDATNLTPHERHSWIKLAKDYGYEVHAVYFDVPVEVCLERNQRRQRVVPEDVMRRMAGKMRPPTFEEGFAKITVVRVKQKD